MVQSGRRPVTGLCVGRILYEVLGKILINCWRLALRVHEDGTTKMRKQRNQKNEETKVVRQSGEK